MYGVPSNAPKISTLVPADLVVSDAANTETDKCNICFGSLGTQRTIVVVPCTHSYHKSCIDQLPKAPDIKDCPSCSRSVTHCLSSEEMPLLVAAAKGRPDAVSCLLDLGLNVNCSTKDGLTPLHCAAIKGDVATIEHLLSHGASVNAVTSGKTPLHFAAEHGQQDAIWLLLEKRANINSQALLMETPSEISDRRLFHALYYQSERLQGLPGDIHLKCLSTEAQIKSYGNTPLHSAIKAGQEQAVNALANAGADTEVLIGEDKTLLRWAKDEGKLSKSLVSILAQATCDTEAPCKGTRAALLGALIEINEWNLFDKLRAKTRGVDLDKLKCPGSSQLAFYRSVECGQPENIKAMIKRGADVNARDDDCRTPLFCAVNKGRPESIIATLIEENADVNAPMKFGWTALHLAARKGLASTVELLIDANANVDASISSGEPTSPSTAADRYKDNNTNGGTPLHIAVESCQPEIVKRLIAANADVNAHNTAGHTPLKIAQVLGSIEISRASRNSSAALERIESYINIVHLLKSAPQAVYRMDFPGT
ncbi:ankyrin repeat domain-containing protein [Thalassotalea sp. G20_0]|uniref:ankyrin repeat domain-containing protein n=1 Tax=Thalassotalea sp. G20_0 TaxID=2821093 RepID=UPI001ADC37DF|nr:ankyrin repeat domain-containing protein [Thalassotalea sp. G20_0]MBO9493910.1 ankyrin repeat domain-containing protein [Thalassotalea sp. G20_0]